MSPVEILARAEREFAHIRRLVRGEASRPDGETLADAIDARAAVAEAMCRVAAAQVLPKHVMDDDGNWVTRDFILTRSPHGLSDRPAAAIPERIAS